MVVALSTFRRWPCVRLAEGTALRFITGQPNCGALALTAGAQEVAPMRIGLFGQFGNGNLGNDGSLEALVTVLKMFPISAELVCICPGASVVEAAYGVEAVGISGTAAYGRSFALLDRIFFSWPRRLSNLIRSFRLTRKLDVMIVPGTGILDDFREPAHGWPYIILRWCLAARWNRVPIYFVSIGAGPIRGRLSRIFLVAAARIATSRSYRDHLSHDFMSAMGIDGKQDKVNCDLAFSLPAPAEEPRKGSAPLCVGVGVMNYAGWIRAAEDGRTIYETYFEKIRDFVRWLLDRGMQVRLLTGGIDDGVVVEALLADFRESASSITAGKISSLHDLMAEITQTDIVVATRYHNVVCALMMGRPTISLGYARKNDELLTRAGLGAYCHDVETFEPPLLKRQVDAMIEQRDLLQPQIRSVVEQFRLELDEQARDLGRDLNSLRLARAERSPQSHAEPCRD